MAAPKKPSKPRERVSAATSDPTWAIARSIVSPNLVERDPYRGHATVYRCVRVIVGAMMRVPLVAKRGQRPTGVVQEDGAWADLMQRPNPNQTRRQLVEATGTYLLTTGECLWYLEGKGGPARVSEVPEQIWALPKGAAEPILDERTRSVILGWRLTTTTGVLEVPAHAVLQFKYSFDPSNPLRGLGPIGAAATAMRSDMKAEAWSEAFYDNAAEPGGILSTEGVLTPKQREDMRMAWEAKHGGVSKRGRVAVLEGGLTYQQVGISQRDMDFIEQRKWNDTQIARVFGVPKFFLMDAQDISYASTRQAKRALWELAVLPIIDMMEDVIEARMTSTRDAAIWLEFDVAKVEALKEDLAANLESAEKLARLGYPVNEINARLDLGMERQEWGDEGTLPMGVAPAATVAGGEPEAPAPAAAPGQQGDNGQGGENGQPANLDAVQQQDRPPETEGLPPANRAAEGRTRRLARWQQVNRAVLQPGTQKFRARVRGWMNSRRGELLRFMASKAQRAPGDMAGDFARELEAFLLGAEERWADLLNRQTQAVYRDIFRLAAEDLADELGKPAGFFSMGDPMVGRYLQEKAVKIKGVSDTVIAGLRKTLAEGVVAQDNLIQLQDRVREVFRAGNSRTQTIAATETAQATNGARQAVMEKAGVKRQEWITSEDAFVRDEDGIRKNQPANHRELDGKIVPVGSSFVQGIHLHYPGDVQAPPQWVINCRCVAGAVLEE